jgi:hypothetical protein
MKNSSRSKLGIAAVLVALSTVACTNKAVNDPVAPASQNAGTLPTEVTLGPDNYADIPGANLRVIFDNVVSDSRCPTSVACVWAGSATIQLTTSLLSGDKSLRQITLATETGKDTTTVYGQAIKLVRVDPVLTSTAPIPLSAYRVTVRVGTSK